MSELKTYRFVAVGAETYVGSHKMNRIGQRFQMSDSDARNAQMGGAALIPDSDFHRIGFTEQELKIWGSPFMSSFDTPGDPDDAKAKAVFLAKVAEAQALYLEIRQGLLNQPTAPAESAIADAVVEPMVEEEKEDLINDATAE